MKASNFDLPNVPIKAYQPVTPAANRVLRAKWDKDLYQIHRQRVHGAKAVVDCWPPTVPMHVHLKLKKLQGNVLKNMEIERVNRIMLEKISYTMRSKGPIDNWNVYTSRKWTSVNRQQTLLQRTHENQAILKRIAMMEPFYDHREWEKQWRIQQGYMINLSKYPDQWDYSKYAMKYSSVVRGPYQRPKRQRKTWHADVMDKVKSAYSIPGFRIGEPPCSRKLTI